MISIIYRSSQNEKSLVIGEIDTNGNYEYYISGVYPLDNYFGVKDIELISVKQLISAKVEKETLSEGARRKRS